MNANEFLHLHPVGQDPCSIDKAACAIALGDWLCGACGALRPGTGAVDVQIQEPVPTELPITFVNGCGVIIATRDFLSSLGAEWVRSDLMLGDLVGPSGRKLSDWATVRARRRVIVRGSRNVSHRRCETCGQVHYFAMGDRYLFPSPATDASIYESDLYGLVLRSQLADGIDLRKWPRLGIETLKVVDVPRDQLLHIESA